jgi:transcriptional regulator with XRE-family HTH domain
MKITGKFMELNDKIKQILIDKSISPSHFADEIGVQRSSISHILAGRNKPSLDIIQKIIRRYPDLGMDWIWEDDEMPNFNKPETISVPREYGRKNDKSIPVISVPDSRKKIHPLPNIVQSNLSEQNSELFETKSIERILVFYSDGTFKQYKPE